VLRQSHTGLLGQAAVWLRQSLDRSPGQPMARLHLGRTQTLRGEHQEAEQLLLDATKAQDGAIGYLAWLFMGALYERLNRQEPALDAYRRATERFPLGQAAMIAQGAVLARLGQGTEAAAILETLLATDAGRRHDPWRQYFFEPAGRADARLDAIRRQVRQ
jgi:predicted Zn-dependent protease